MTDRRNKPGVFCSLLVIIMAIAGCSGPGRVSVFSPDGNLNFRFLSLKADSGKIEFSLSAGNREVLLPSTFQLRGDIPGLTSEYKVTRIEKSSHSKTWFNNFGERREVPDNYNQVKIFMQNSGVMVNLICRVYNEGAAFAYELPRQEGIDTVKITDEKTLYRLPDDYMAWSAPRAQAQYSHVPVSRIARGSERPLVVEYDTSLTIAFAEAGLVDFARMKFDPDTSDGIAIRSRLDGEVRRRAPFQSPWRVVMVGNDPGDLLEKNYLILNLNDSCQIYDVSWIRPGKVLREITLTTSGAMASVDFAAVHNMQYIEFDAGWYGPENSEDSDARAVNLDPKRSKGPLDLEKVIKYAHSKGIDVLLYVNRRALEKQLDDLLPIYKKWGIAGIKFGFVQVGSQEATRWLHESIKKLVPYGLVADVHDEYRPTGFSRTYPNLLTMEGIRGDEESPSNSHTLITMFTRMLAGQGDNTICYYDRRVDERMGSHASQLAKAVCLFSPLQFMYWYDKPVSSPEMAGELKGKPNYLGDEPELEFFDNIPTVWDSTLVLHARIAEYGVIARKWIDDWFIGGINGEKERILDIDFSFLKPGVKYTASIYSDDPSVETRTHVRIDRIEVDNKTVLPVRLGANKGIAMHLVMLK